MTLPRILIDQFEPWLGELDAPMPQSNRLREATADGARGIRAFVEMTAEIEAPLKRAERNSLLACALLDARKERVVEADLDEVLTTALLSMRDLQRALSAARPTNWAINVSVAWSG